MPPLPNLPLAETLHEVRLDKWLWAVRVFKTRAMASEAIQAGKVSVDQRSAKCSHRVKVGQLISCRKGPGEIQIHRVLKLLFHRVGASQVPNFAENLTPARDPSKETKSVAPLFYRPPGKGKPTKKERREIERHRSFF